MKILITILAISFVIYFVLGFLVGCSSESEQNQYLIDTRLKVVEIDRCEYFFIRLSSGKDDFVLTHKGNCKNSIHLKSSSHIEKYYRPNIDDFRRNIIYIHVSMDHN